MHCHQLYGTILLLPLYCPTAVGYLYQCKYKAPDKIWKTTCNALRNLYGRPSLCSDPISLLSGWEMINPMASKARWRICVAHFHMWAVAVCKLPSQTSVAIMQTNIRPEIIANTFQFSGLVFLEGYIVEYLSATRCHLKVLHRIRRGSSSLTQGLHGPLIKDDRSR